MPKSPYAPCIPTRGTKVPSHSDWIHEVKQDGFRLIFSLIHFHAQSTLKPSRRWHWAILEPFCANHLVALCECDVLQGLRDRTIWPAPHHQHFVRSCSPAFQ